MFDGDKSSNRWLLLAGVILIPVSVAAVSLWADARNEQRQRTLNQMISERQERLTVTQMIDTYFHGIATLLAAEMSEPLRERIIIARTDALLQRLDAPQDNALIVRFLAGVRAEVLGRPARTLERAKSPYVSLAGVDLRGTDLSFVNLYRADLSGARLQGADLSWANLGGADLSRANLAAATLNGTELSRADLRDGVLSASSLAGASFVDADLRGADLARAEIGAVVVDGLTLDTDFDGARLEGAIWPDGRVCGAADDCLAGARD